ncbi:MAG: trehalose-phosphatase [Alphaproteobacteria bacterium]|nr:trehalose-phosphatase [Alphaproteobacteria bacterium]
MPRHALAPGGLADLHETAWLRPIHVPEKSPPPLPDSEDAPGWALFLDVDGTLLQIAETPGAVEVSARLRDLLERLEPALGGALALISGRSIANLDRLFGSLGLAVAGQHGMERRDAAGGMHHAEDDGVLESLRGPLEAFAEVHPGVVLEDKGRSMGLHYRQAPEAENAARAFIRQFAEKRDDVNILDGRMIFDIKPAHVDKGTAIATFMLAPPFAGCRPVFIGDDATDEQGFPVVNEMDGISVRVGDGAETAATYRLMGVDAVLDWLTGVADALDAAGEGAA